ncbi:hypothetical protein RIF29_10960 [Crotalaria pallida]|uniref:Uncharacterized protein n=1 Tax=Crotalaria pallida TaxID=3830 RepID=A0AAN9FTF3_CROPI
MVEGTQSDGKSGCRSRIAFRNSLLANVMNHVRGVFDSKTPELNRKHVIEEISNRCESSLVRLSESQHMTVNSEVGKHLDVHAKHVTQVASVNNWARRHAVISPKKGQRVSYKSVNQIVRQLSKQFSDATVKGKSFDYKSVNKIVHDLFDHDTEDMEFVGILSSEACKEQKKIVQRRGRKCQEDSNKLEVMKSDKGDCDRPQDNGNVIGKKSKKYKVHALNEFLLEQVGEKW